MCDVCININSTTASSLCTHIRFQLCIDHTHTLLRCLPPPPCPFALVPCALLLLLSMHTEYVSCSSVAAVLDISEQQCQLLVDTLAALGGSSSVREQGFERSVNLHELSLFLLAQIYGREAHR